MTQIIHDPMESTPHIRILDEWTDTIPEDLYIPPAAFEILLEHFEGPLDFLIYLIQKSGFDLLQVDIAPIATQYLSYMDSMKSLNIELTADYMVMAALLADLKSRLLLPKPTSVHIEKDPKQELIDRLETYLRIKKAAERLGQMPVFERDTFSTNVAIGHIAKSYDGYQADMLRDAIFCIFNRPEPITHQIVQEPVLLEERIAYIEHMIDSGEVLSFEQLLKPSQGRMGMVVTFMAILELTRQQKVNIISTGIEAPLSIQGALQ
ncbi:ScpA family protein [Acinetobacter gerneri]|jgi:segregation and condensation protein A|uniref:Segregation and condensation protein A n=1 Tax=Acinetobacter gerneri TaxID=202952 RepID=A0AAW8JH08_9GAMM|nr:ScpA family protein [Acinetobacter gerneri]MCH4245365.1 segregation/condensation protein A [Acinetobacter gerneri]MDQ9009417.1 ScpA family protein [Acinetobacter gerneri]MDQ9013381.1 ScpA family protein [Acinetobacter gerneri]MDQ9024663.1 ScpA family protein [Acinetobacter gerneri]MDQ9052053.1 ScpA family protein [Acinetobacter gerneri]